MRVSKSIQSAGKRFVSFVFGTAKKKITGKPKPKDRGELDTTSVKKIVKGGTIGITGLELANFLIEIEVLPVDISLRLFGYIVVILGISINLLRKLLAKYDINLPEKVEIE